MYVIDVSVGDAWTASCSCYLWQHQPPSQDVAGHRPSGVEVRAWLMFGSAARALADDTVQHPAVPRSVR